MCAHNWLDKMLAGLVGFIIISINVERPACAQTPAATLSGTVVDERRAVVPSVRITVINNSTSFQRQTTTNDEGYFIIPLLPPATYTLTAEMPGFTTVTVNDLVLQVSTNSAVNIILLPGEIAESIEVLSTSSIGADGNRVDITSATTKHSIANKQVVSLPVLTSTFGRNTLGVLPFVAPGVTLSSPPGSRMISSGQLDTNGLSGFELGLLQANRFGDQISINGSRPSSTSFTIDGGDNNDHELNQAASPLPNPDALQELTIITGSYQADLGRSSGGIINAVVRSGTSSYRGNLRHFLINEALNARSFFDRERPRDRLNTFGGQLGGPLEIPRLFKGKDRTYFFLDYEGTRRLLPGLALTHRVPTVRERAGDFSDLERWPIDPLTGRAFDNGIIPNDRIDPISRIYLERFIPLPDDGERGLRQTRSTTLHNEQITLRLDNKIGAGGSLSLTFFHNLSDVTEGSAYLPVASKTDTRVENRNLILRETHVVSARMVNQFTLALTRVVTSRQVVAPGITEVHPSRIGFSGIRPGELISLPRVHILGRDVLTLVGAGQPPMLNARNTWQIKDDLSHTIGAHALKFGPEARGFLHNSSTAGDSGSFTFGSSPFDDFGTGNSFADFLLGIPSGYSQSSGSAHYPRQRAYYFYAMDDWRVRANLTINLGLRYELSPPLVDKLDQVNVFRPGQRSERFPDAPRGLLFAGDRDPVLGRVPRGTYLADYNNLAPRLSLAYSPRLKGGWSARLFGEGKTALRAAWGVFYDQTYGLSFTRLLSSPFSISQSLSSNQISAAGGSFANPFGSLPNPFPFDPSRVVFPARPAIRFFSPAFRTAYSYHYNLTIQRELPWSLLMETGYVGNNGFKLSRERDLNQRSIYRQFSSILWQESTGRARYDSLQVKLARKVTTGMTIDGSYVYSKSLDNSSHAPDFTPDRWARSSFDRTHNIVVNYTFSLPDLKLAGMLRHLLSGWQTAGITEFRSGLPLDIHQLGDATLTGDSPSGIPDLVGPYMRLDPRKRQTIVVNGVPHTGNFFFDPRSFRAVVVRSPSDTRAGNLGRNVFDGPGINLWSISVARRFRLTENQNLMLRSDISNLFNRTHFHLSPFNLNARTPPFGQVSTAAPGRNIQLSLRYSF